MMRKCVICGKEFVPYRKIQKTCSPECSAENHRARTRMLCKQYKAEERASRVYEPIKCKFCGKEFTPTHGNARYCSPECKMEAFRPAGASEHIKRVRRPRIRECAPINPPAEYPESSAACMRGLSRSTMQSISDAVFGPLLKGGVG